MTNGVPYERLGWLAPARQLSKTVRRPTAHAPALRAPKGFHMLPESRARQARTSPELSRIAVQSSDEREARNSLRSSIPDRGCIIPLSNLRGSKVRVVNRLGWLMQIQSICARSRSPKCRAFAY